METLENKSSVYTNNSALSSDTKKQPRSLSKNSNRKSSSDGKTGHGVGISAGATEGKERIEEQKMYGYRPQSPNIR